MRLQAERDEAIEQKARAEEKLDSLASSLVELTSRVSTVEDKLESSETLIKKLEKDLGESEAEVQLLRSLNDGKGSSLKKLEEDLLKRIMAERDSLLLSSESNLLQQLKDRLKALESDCAMIRSSDKATSMKCEEVQSRLERSEAKNGQLHAEMRNSEAALRLFESKLVIAEADIRKVKTKAELNRESIARLKSQMESKRHIIQVIQAEDSSKPPAKLPVENQMQAGAKVDEEPTYENLNEFNKQRKGMLSSYQIVSSLYCQMHNNCSLQSYEQYLYNTYYTYN